jgi:SAM-dependent methyltransferase
MNIQGSYHISTIASNVEKEMQRLKAQVDLFWAQELKQYVEFGLRDGLSIAELGSGPGFLTEKLLATFPHLKVIAIEIDPFLVAYAKDYLSPKKQVSQRHSYQCNILQGSLMDTGLAANSFDFAITRLVLEHLPDPGGAIQVFTGRFLARAAWEETREPRRKPISWTQPMVSPE